MPLFPDMKPIGKVDGGPKPPSYDSPEPPSLLEDDFHDTYHAWKRYQSPESNGLMLKKLDPIIQSAVKTYGGVGSPTLVSKAKLMTLNALPDYDPSKSKLKTYLMGHLQGLRRVAAKENQILAVPEQVQLDHYHLHTAENELRDHLGRDPSTGELADKTGLSMKRISYVRRLRPAMSEGSMQSPMAGSDSDDFNEPEVKSQGNDAHAWQRFVYDSLDPTDQLIMEHSMGMNRKRILANQEIAKLIGVTPSAVSQRKARIQMKMDDRNKHGIL